MENYWTSAFTWHVDDLTSNAYRLYKSNLISEEGYEALMNMPLEEREDMLNDIIFGSEESIIEYINEIISNELHQRFKSI
jgi:hypothetical protein